MKTRLMTTTLLSLALFSTSAAFAAVGDAPATPQGQKTVQAMFTFADQNQDGRLTRAEAKGHLPATYSSFDTIDTAKRGWISYEQYIEFTNQRANKQADAVLKVGDWH